MMAKTKKIIDRILKISWWVAFILLFILVAGIVCAKFKGEVPSVFGYSVVRITTPSMGETIPVDTYILIKRTPPKEIKENDIICFYSEDANIYGYPNTHRVIDVVEVDGKYEYVTKGDANALEDGVTAKADKLIGRYVKTLKGITWISEQIKAQGMAVISVIMLLATSGVIIATIVITSKEENKEKK